MERPAAHAAALFLLALGLLAPRLFSDAHLSGDAADYRFVAAPEEVPLTPIGVQAETHRWGSEGHRMTLGFDSPRVLQGVGFQVAVKIDAPLTKGPVKVTPRFVTKTNAWREEEETDDLYSYLQTLAAQASLEDGEVEGPLDGDAAAAAAYAAAAPPRRLEQFAASFVYTPYPPLLPERRKTGEFEETRRLAVCPEEVSENDEKKRTELLKKAGFTEEMECDVKSSRSFISTRMKKEERLQPLAIPPQYLPPNSPRCEGDLLCGKVYCAIVDCTRAVTRAVGGGENLLWIPNGQWELDLHFDWAPEEVPIEGDIRVEIREVPPSPPGEILAREKKEEEPPGNLALVATANLATLFAALPGLRFDMTVEKAGFPNRPPVLGLFAAQLEFSFQLGRPIPRERGPLLRLRFPSVACGTQQEALRTSGEPAWTRQKLRECWDVHQTCLSLSSGFLFNSCQEGFVETNGLEVRTITLGDPKGDITEGNIVLHGVYPPTTNTTEVSSEFLLEILQTFSEERLAEKSEIDKCNQRLEAAVAGEYCFKESLARQINTTMNYANASVVASQSFFTPALQTVEAVVRAQPNDDYPFPVAFTFVAPEEIYKGGLELYIPQKTFLYDPGPKERYNPYTRNFFTVVTTDLPVRVTGKGTTVTLYPVTMEKGETLTVYLPLKAFSLSSGAPWPAPKALAYPDGAESEYSLKMSNLQRKPTAEITRVPSPVYTPGMVAAVMGPELQYVDGTNTLASFRLKFGEEIPSGKLEIWVTPLLNASATSSGSHDPAVTGACSGWFKSIEEMVSELTCPPGTGSFLYSLLPSSLAAQFVAGWVSLGFRISKPMNLYPYVGLAVKDSAGTLVYSVELPSPSSYQNPCIQRFSSHLITPSKTGYAAKLLLVMQIVNCNNPAEPLRAMEDQVEPLAFSLPKLNGLNEIDYISSVTIHRTSHPETVSLSSSDILLGIKSRSSSFFRPLPRTAPPSNPPETTVSACRKTRDTCMPKGSPPAGLDVPSHINPSFSPRHLPRDPRLAAASVHLAFPHPRRLGRVTVPSGLRHVAQQRSPLAAPASEHAEVSQQAVRIVVDLIVDETLGAEASLMLSEWGYANLYAQPRQWCNARGMECYGHNWKEAGVFQWGSSEPKTANGTLPEEWQAVKATKALQPVIEWRQSVSCDEIPAHLSVVILLTDKATADEYEALLRSGGGHPKAPAWEDRPVHVHVIGFTEISYKPSEDPLAPLKQLPVTSSTNMLRQTVVDAEMSLLAEEKVFVSFATAMPLAGQYEGDALISSLEEALYLVTEEFAQSILTVEICRHPVPPPDYKFPWASHRDATDPTYRAIQVAYNGETLDKMVEFNIPASELGVYTAAKLDWQFRMACDGQFSPAA